MNPLMIKGFRRFVLKITEDFNHQHRTPRTENGIVYGDLPKFVDFDYVAKVARLNAPIMASLASAPAAPSKMHIPVKKLENDTTLAWGTFAGRISCGL